MQSARTRLTRLAAVALTTVTLAAPAAPALAQDAYIGQLKAFPMNWCPRSYARADGTLLPIAQNTALFSLIGTIYGGNGTTTFALPNLNGRTPIHNGRGPGLSMYTQGQASGTETVTLNTSQLPAHSHSLRASSANGTLSHPQNAYPATGVGPGRGSAYYDPTAASDTMAANAVTMTGGSQPHENRPPFITLNWCIATQGLYPPRS
ncbi:phage tail protein [Sagittula sp. S175]|uniref:phage tail protein n=1 Tax=Sagittula sp. S175 TaxID=3415129 RepID=UPI003C7AF915